MGYPEVSSECHLLSLHLAFVNLPLDDKIGTGFICNGAKLGDATVARAPPLLCPPRNFIV